jgi:hypothetical protein
MSDDEGPIRHGAASDDGVRREPVASNRSELGGTRLQHAVSPPEEHPSKIPYCGSTDPLHQLIDSAGIKVEGEGEWHAR